MYGRWVWGRDVVREVVRVVVGSVTCGREGTVVWVVVGEPPAQKSTRNENRPDD